MMLSWLCAIWLAVGFVAGAAYFTSIWWSAEQFATGGKVPVAIMLTLVRLVALGGLLVLASVHGAGPLLALALGVVAARLGVMRQFRKAMP